MGAERNVFAFQDSCNASGLSMAEVAFVRCLKQVGNSNIIGVKKEKERKRAIKDGGRLISVHG
jgi:hypothetical protein